MKRLLLAGLIMLSVSCARITYKDGEMSYWRLGDQKIENLAIEKDAKGKVKVSFDHQTGTSGDLSKALLNITEVVGKMALIP